MLVLDAISALKVTQTILYGLQKYDLKYGLSVHIKIKGRFKSQFYMQNTIFFLITNIKVIYFARFDDITRRDGISTYNLR